MLPCYDTLFHDVLPRVPLAQGDATLIFCHELSPFPSFSCGRLFTQSSEWFATRKVKSFTIRQIQFTHREGRFFTPSIKWPKTHFAKCRRTPIQLPLESTLA